eukprot:TRINITY_DN7087_c0_g2_i2.p1 TRINITY_DN7087_c0_g2~~TRINITY_DN7087_c0_g2_i2.p1  ORF type:complete len:349 (-),score=87.19 TRINITY_DN7087_c0_g2_i2:68-1114(-)
MADTPADHQSDQSESTEFDLSEFDDLERTVRETMRLNPNQLSELDSMMHDLETESERVRQDKQHRASVHNDSTGYVPPPITPSKTSQPMNITTPTQPQDQEQLKDMMGSSLARHFNVLNDTLESSERQMSNHNHIDDRDQQPSPPADPKHSIVSQFAPPQRKDSEDTDHMEVLFPNSYSSTTSTSSHHETNDHTSAQQSEQQDDDIPKIDVRSPSLFGSIPNMDRIHSYLGFKFGGVKPGSLETNNDFLGSSPFARVFSRKAKKNQVKTPEQQINQHRSDTSSDGLQVPTYGKRAYSNKGTSTFDFPLHSTIQVIPSVCCHFFLKSREKKCVQHLPLPLTPSQSNITG